MPITFDDTRYPIVVITMTGATDAAEFDAATEELVSLMRGAQRVRRKIGLMVDGRGAIPPGANRRRQMAAFLVREADLMADSLSGQVMVLANPIQRGVLAAVLWWRPFPHPHFVTGNPDEGLRWLASMRSSAA